jgi:hypothetical protein
MLAKAKVMAASAGDRAKVIAASAGDKAAQAADQAARSAKKTKLSGEIMVLQSKVAAAKKAFGLAVYDVMVAGDQAEVDRVFGTARFNIQMLEQLIEDKRGLIALLNIPTPRQSMSQSFDTDDSPASAAAVPSPLHTGLASAAYDGAPVMTNAAEVAHAAVPSPRAPSTSNPTAGGAEIALVTETPSDAVEQVSEPSPLTAPSAPPASDVPATVTATADPTVEATLTPADAAVAAS